MAARQTTSTGIREHNTAAVLESLRASRPASRAELARRTGLSKPTIGAAIRDLEAVGLVREFGRTTGRRGPSASLYDLVPDAVSVLGIDIGAHYVRAVLADLDARPLHEVTLQLSQPDAEAVLACVREIHRAVTARSRPVELAVVGSPGIVDPATGRISAAPNIEGWDGVLAERVLSSTLEMQVRVENDVNLAALGEHRAGSGRDADSFAYLSIGSGLGAGLILHGQLHRGARGASGEIGFLPVGEDPFDPTTRALGGPMEARLSSHALVDLADRLAATTTTALEPPFDVEALFDAAANGDALGRAIVAHAARATAVCIAGLTSVVDLELVLLGGGIGLNSELLLPDVRAATAELVPAPPEIRCAALGEHAVCAGATSLGLEIARESVVHRLVRGDGHGPSRASIT
jgi:predicted NBD/HSP70 family sugar kinase